ncbi:MAG: hypothetical protein DYH02_06310 [Candidatus Omnitrophica bacterium COP1]|nr:hypothetical protein [Candidatus Omnitrophica bacterium COP1]
MLSFVDGWPPNGILFLIGKLNTVGGGNRRPLECAVGLSIKTPGQVLIFFNVLCYFPSVSPVWRFS